MTASATDSRKPLIAIDFTAFDRSNMGAGQYRYMVQLIRGFSRKSGIRFLVVGSLPEPVPEIRDIIGSHPDWDFTQLRPHSYRFNDITYQLRYSWLLRRRRADLFHATHMAVPFFPPCPVLLTKYDLMEEIFDEYAAIRSHRTYRMHKSACRTRVDRIISISRCTHDDLVRFFKVDPQKSRVIYLAVDSSVKPEAPAFATDPDWVSHIEGGSPWLLSPYNLEPRKNLPGLCRAMPEILRQHPDTRLVLFGRAAWSEQREKDFDAELEKLGIAPCVHRTGFVSEGELVWLYANASIFVFPTFYEGFGYPIIEAMSAGACVVAGNTSSMAELLDGVGTGVDVRDSQSIAGAVSSLLSDPDRRAEAGRKGREWAAGFSLDNLVDQTFATYLEMLGMNNS